jgi:hypothetical protein
MVTPTVAWDEGSPAGSQSRSLGDDRIREMKTQIREVIAVDHEMGSSGQSDTTGYHNKVTFVEQASSPSMVANTIMLFAKEIGGKTELFMDSYDSTDTEMQLTSNGSFVGGMAGEVRMWSGLIANIPVGWLLCDGGSGTPNLVGKFIRGVNSNVTNPGTTGGADTIASVINHTHPAGIANGTTGNESSDHTHYMPLQNLLRADGGGSGNITAYIASTGYLSTYGQTAHHTHSLIDGTVNVSNPSGGVASMDNRPAYYELAYIIMA